MRRSDDAAAAHVPFFKRLIVQFLLVALLASTAAFFFNHFISSQLPEWLGSHGPFQSYWNARIDSAFADLQKDVTENNRTCDEVIESTQHRISTEAIVFFFEQLPFLNLEDPEQREYLQTHDVFVLQCADGNLISSSYSIGNPITRICNLTGMIGGTVISCLILSAYVLHLLHRINKLCQQILYSRDTDINKSISLKGQDELAWLAQNTEKMRAALLELLEKEKKTQENQIQLIAMLSHDIRNPLTKLMGYAEILHYQKYSSQEEQTHCITYILETVRRLKDMTDNLLNCVLVNKQTVHDDTQLVDGPAFLTQILFEGFCCLEDAGFSVSLPALSGSYALNICISDFQRIIDNLSSNILKYASADYPILIEAAEEPDMIHLSVSNRKAILPKNVQRHEIGLVSVRELVEKMEGSVEISDQSSTFSVRISLPKAAKVPAQQSN